MTDSPPDVKGCHLGMWSFFVKSRRRLGNNQVKQQLKECYEKVQNLEEQTESLERQQYVQRVFRAAVLDALQVIELALQRAAEEGRYIVAPGYGMNEEDHVVPGQISRAWQTEVLNDAFHGWSLRRLKKFLKFGKTKWKLRKYKTKLQTLEVKKENLQTCLQQDIWELGRLMLKLEEKSEALRQAAYEEYLIQHTKTVTLDMIDVADLELAAFTIELVNQNDLKDGERLVKDHYFVEMEKLMLQEQCLQEEGDRNQTDIQEDVAGVVKKTALNLTKTYLRDIEKAEEDDVEQKCFENRAATNECIFDDAVESGALMRYSGIEETNREVRCHHDPENIIKVKVLEAIEQKDTEMQTFEEYGNLEILEKDIKDEALDDILKKIVTKKGELSALVENYMEKAMLHALGQILKGQRIQETFRDEMLTTLVENDNMNMEHMAVMQYIFIDEEMLDPMTLNWTERAWKLDGWMKMLKVFEQTLTKNNHLVNAKENMIEMVEQNISKAGIVHFVNHNLMDRRMIGLLNLTSKKTEELAVLVETMTESRDIEIVGQNTMKQSNLKVVIPNLTEEIMNNYWEPLENDFLENKMLMILNQNIMKKRELVTLEQVIIEKRNEQSIEENILENREPSVVEMTFQDQEICESLEQVLRKMEQETVQHKLKDEQFVEIVRSNELMSRELVVVEEGNFQTLENMLRNKGELETVKQEVEEKCKILKENSDMKDKELDLFGQTEEELLDENLEYLDKILTGEILTGDAFCEAEQQNIMNIEKLTIIEHPLKEKKTLEDLEQTFKEEEELEIVQHDMKEEIPDEKNNVRVGYLETFQLNLQEIENVVVLKQNLISMKEFKNLELIFKKEEEEEEGEITEQNLTKNRVLDTAENNLFLTMGHLEEIFDKQGDLEVLEQNITPQKVEENLDENVLNLRDAEIVEYNFKDEDIFGYFSQTLEKRPAVEEIEHIITQIADCEITEQIIFSDMKLHISEENSLLEVFQQSLQDKEEVSIVEEGMNEEKIPDIVEFNTVKESETEAMEHNLVNKQVLEALDQALEDNLIERDVLKGSEQMFEENAEVEIVGEVTKEQSLGKDEGHNITRDFNVGKQSSMVDEMLYGFYEAVQILEQTIAQEKVKDIPEKSVKNEGDLENMEQSILEEKMDVASEQTLKAEGVLETLEQSLTLENVEEITEQDIVKDREFEVSELNVMKDTLLGASEQSFQGKGVIDVVKIDVKKDSLGDFVEYVIVRDREIEVAEENVMEDEVPEISDQTVKKTEFEFLEHNVKEVDVRETVKQSIMEEKLENLENKLMEENNLEVSQPLLLIKGEVEDIEQYFVEEKLAVNIGKDEVKNGALFVQKEMLEVLKQISGSKEEVVFGKDIIENERLEEFVDQNFVKNNKSKYDEQNSEQEILEKDIEEENLEESTDYNFSFNGEKETKKQNVMKEVMIDSLDESLLGMVGIAQQCINVEEMEETMQHNIEDRELKILEHNVDGEEILKILEKISKNEEQPEISDQFLKGELTERFVDQIAVENTEFKAKALEQNVTKVSMLETWEQTLQKNEALEFLRQNNRIEILENNSLKDKNSNDMEKMFMGAKMLAFLGQTIKEKGELSILGETITEESVATNLGKNFLKHSQTEVVEHNCNDQEHLEVLEQSPKATEQMETLEHNIAEESLGEEIVRQDIIKKGIYFTQKELVEALDKILKRKELLAVENYSVGDKFAGFVEQNTLKKGESCALQPNFMWEDLLEGLEQTSEKQSDLEILEQGIKIERTKMTVEFNIRKSRELISFQQNFKEVDMLDFLVQNKNKKEEMYNIEQASMEETVETKGEGNDVKGKELKVVKDNCIDRQLLQAFAQTTEVKGEIKIVKYDVREEIRGESIQENNEMNGCLEIFPEEKGIFKDLEQSLQKRAEMEVVRHDALEEKYEDVLEQKAEEKKTEVVEQYIMQKGLLEALGPISERKEEFGIIEHFIKGDRVEGFVEQNAVEKKEFKVHNVMQEDNLESLELAFKRKEKQTSVEEHIKNEHFVETLEQNFENYGELGIMEEICMEREILETVEQSSEMRCEDTVRKLSEQNVETGNYFNSLKTNLMEEKLETKRDDEILEQDFVEKKTEEIIRESIVKQEDMEVAQQFIMRKELLDVLWVIAKNIKDMDFIEHYSKKENNVMQNAEKIVDPSIFKHNITQEDMLVALQQTLNKTEEPQIVQQHIQDGRLEETVEQNVANCKEMDVIKQSLANENEVSKVKLELEIVNEEFEGQNIANEGEMEAFHDKNLEQDLLESLEQNLTKSGELQIAEQRIREVGLGEIDFKKGELKAEEQSSVKAEMLEVLEQKQGQLETVEQGEKNERMQSSLEQSICKEQKVEVMQETTNREKMLVNMKNISKTDDELELIVQDCKVETLGVVLEPDTLTEGELKVVEQNIIEEKMLEDLKQTLNTDTEIVEQVIGQESLREIVKENSELDHVEENYNKEKSALKQNFKPIGVNEVVDCPVKEEKLKEYSEQNHLTEELHIMKEDLVNEDTLESLENKKLNIVGQSCTLARQNDVLDQGVQIEVESEEQSKHFVEQDNARGGHAGNFNEKENTANCREELLSDTVMQHVVRKGELMMIEKKRTHGNFVGEGLEQTYLEKGEILTQGSNIKKDGVREFIEQNLVNDGCLKAKEQNSLDEGMIQGLEQTLKIGEMLEFVTNISEEEGLKEFVEENAQKDEGFESMQAKVTAEKWDETENLNILKNKLEVVEQDITMQYSEEAVQKEASNENKFKVFEQRIQEGLTKFTDQNVVKQGELESVEMHMREEEKIALRDQGATEKGRVEDIIGESCTLNIENMELEMRETTEQNIVGEEEFQVLKHSEQLEQNMVGEKEANKKVQSVLAEEVKKNDIQVLDQTNKEKKELSIIKHIHEWIVIEDEELKDTATEQILIDQGMAEIKRKTDWEDQVVEQVPLRMRPSIEAGEDLKIANDKILNVVQDRKVEGGKGEGEAKELSCFIIKVQSSQHKPVKQNCIETVVDVNNGNLKDTKSTVINNEVVDLTSRECPEKDIAHVQRLKFVLQSLVSNKGLKSNCTKRKIRGQNATKKPGQCWLRKSGKDINREKFVKKCRGKDTTDNLANRKMMNILKKEESKVPAHCVNNTNANKLFIEEIIISDEIVDHINTESIEVYSTVPDIPKEASLSYKCFVKDLMEVEEEGELGATEKSTADICEDETFFTALENFQEEEFFWTCFEYSD